MRLPKNPVQTVELPWGCPIEIDTRETIGRGIWTTGLYDLAVVEVLMRLANPERLAIDAGANIGAMSGAMATRSAEVWAFEPNPVLASRVAANLAAASGRPGFAPCRLFDTALSNREGEARFEIPEGDADNQGLGRIAAEEGGITVRTTRLDTLLGSREVGVMKVDVEGHELALFEGASEALAAGRIAHLVFEDHEGPSSAACRFLTGLGYALYEVGWRTTGPVIALPGSGTHRASEAPSYLATHDPNGAERACRPRGWVCLRRPRR
jgi:FkbM family methyltransferase